jgi:tetratricopeptide (TPR) repeat protein
MSDLAACRSDHDAAGQGFEEALSLYRKLGDVGGQANCISSLGELSWRSDHEATRERFEEALRLYRKVGSLIGEANCIYLIGEIALRVRLENRCALGFVWCLAVIQALDVDRAEPWPDGQDREEDQALLV